MTVKSPKVQFKLEFGQNQGKYLSALTVCKTQKNFFQQMKPVLKKAWKIFRARAF